MVREPKSNGGAPEWEPPKGLEKGIPHDEPVDTEIPLDKISVSKRSLEGAQRNTAAGRGTKTEGPVSLFYNTDNGQFLVEDGMHRIAKAHAEGKTSIPAKLWSGYSDTIANVASEDKAELGKRTVGTAEAAKSDTEHFANAKKELGDKASISDVAKRAQELKDAAKPTFDMIKDADGKPDRLEITSSGKPVGHLKIEEEVPGTWTVKDAVVKDPKKGIGTAAYLQLFDEARKAGVKAVESDISTTKGGAGLWKSLLRDYPEAIKEDNGQYSADPHSNVLAKLGEKKSKFNKIVP
jgi:hypothetical protein